MNKECKRNTLKDTTNVLPNIDYSFINKKIREHINSLWLSTKEEGDARFVYINNDKFVKNIIGEIYTNAFDFWNLSGVDNSLKININDFAYIKEIYTTLCDEQHFTQAKDFEETYKVLCYYLDNKLAEKGITEIRATPYEVYRKDEKHVKFRKTIDSNKNVPIILNTLDTDYKFNISKSTVDNSNILKKGHIKSDECNVIYSIANLKTNAIEGVCNYYNTYYRRLKCNDSLVNEIIDEITMEDGEDAIVSDMIAFVENQRKGCIPRAMSYLYLDYIVNNIDVNKLNMEEKSVLESFKRYVSIFDIFEDVLREMAFDSQDYSLGCSARENVDLISELKKSDALKCLPIIGNVNDSLPNTNKDGCEIIDVCNMNLKLNGKVENHTIVEQPNSFPSSFDYHINYIKAVANSKAIENVKNKPIEIHERDILKKAISNAIIIKSFIGNIVNAEANIPKTIESEIIDAANCCTSPNAAKKWLLKVSADIDKWYHDGYDLISGYKKLLTKWSKGAISKEEIVNTSYKMSFYITNQFLPSEPKEVLICKKNNLSHTHKMKHTFLSKDVNCVNKETIILKQDFVFKFATTTLLSDNLVHNCTWKVCDKYMGFNIVLKPDILNGHAALDVMGNIKFNDNLILVYNASDTYYQTINKLDGSIVVDDNKRFLYECIYAIITSMIYVYFTKKITESAKRTTYLNNTNNVKGVCINQFRLAINRAKNPKSNNFCRTFTKEMDMSTLSKYISVCSQGFDLEPSGTCINKHKVNNAMMSLYSELNKDITTQATPNIEYAAILSVTSITTEKSNGDTTDDDISTVIIKVTEVVSQKNRVKIGNVKKHTYRITKKELYKQSDMIKDIIGDLKKRGCKNIIYIAKAPNVKKLEHKGLEEKELYFFNEQLLTDLQSNTGVNIYPLYVIVNSVSDLREGVGNQIDTSSFYCVYDINKDVSGIVPVCGIFSGISSLNKQGSHYKTLTSYATIKGMYKNNTLNQIINDVVFDDNKKEDIAKILYLYHMFAQQKAPLGRGKILNIKSNPFENLFGDDGIGSMSSFAYNLNIKPNGNSKKTIIHNSFTFADYIVKQSINTYKNNNSNKSNNNKE